MRLFSGIFVAVLTVAQSDHGPDRDCEELDNVHLLQAKLEILPVAAPHTRVGTVSLLLSNSSRRHGKAGLNVQPALGVVDFKGKEEMLHAIHDKVLCIKFITVCFFWLLLLGFGLVWRRMSYVRSFEDEAPELVATAPVATELSAELYLRAKPEILSDLLVDCQGDFLHSVDGRQSLSYCRLREFLEAEEADVRRFGIRSSDRLALLLGNGPEAVVAIFVFTRHCPVYPADPKLSDAELAFALEDLPARAVVAPQEHMPRVNEVQKICLTPDPKVAGLFSLSAQACMAPPPRGQPGRADIALLLHTSGSTKKPKLVPLSHENLLLGAMCIRDTVKLKAGDKCLNMMPLFHIGGLSCNIFATAAASASVVCTVQFSGLQGLRWIETLNPSWYYAGPTIHQLMMSQATAPICPNSLQLIRSGSAALLPSVGKQMQETFNCLVLPTYSMTECMPVCSHHRDRFVDLASVGPAAAPSLCIKGGEVCISGPCLISCYEARAHMDEDPNSAAFDEEGWFHTGDMGTKDRNGYVFLSGRSKEIINRGGEKISPLQVEDALKDGRVKDMVVFSAPHDELGEVVAVAVKAPDVEEKNLLDLLDQLNEQASCAVPQRFLPEVIVQADELPRGRTGKTLRVGLAKKLGLPSTSITKDGDKFRAFTYRNECLGEVGSAQPHASRVALDSLGIVRRGRQIDPEQREVVLAVYAVCATLVVCDHLVFWFGDGLKIFPYMQPWAAAVLETISRSRSSGWRLNCLVMCTAYLNAFEPLQGIRLLVQIGSYAILESDSFEFAAVWLSETISGRPPGSCKSFQYTTYFLRYLIGAQVVFAAGRRLPLPEVQCMAVLAFTLLAYRAAQDNPHKAFEIKWFAMAPYMFAFIYLVVGHYGHTVTSSLRRGSACMSMRASRTTAMFTAVLLLGLLYANVVVTLPFTQLSAETSCPGVGAHLMWDINKAAWFANIPECFLDLAHSFVIMFLLVALILGSGLAPYLSWMGQFSWAIFCVQGALMYCNTPGCEDRVCPTGACRSTFGITVRGVVLLPNLQSALEAAQFSGLVQILLIPLYALVIVVTVCAPYQLVHLRAVQALQALSCRVSAKITRRFNKL